MQPATPPGRPLAEVLDWNLELIRRAEQYGYSEAWMGEHITAPWEPVPAPFAMVSSSS